MQTLPRSRSSKNMSARRFIDQYVSLINAPTEDKPYGKTYTVKYLGNVVGGKPVLYLNLESDKLADMAKQQVQDPARRYGSAATSAKFYERDARHHGHRPVRLRRGPERTDLSA